MAHNSSPSSTAWCVYRQDDSGNIFLVERGLPETEARRLATELESHGHKQVYWVEQE